MTTDKARKRATRALAAEHGISYTAAHRRSRSVSGGAQAGADETGRRRPFMLSVTSPKGGTGKTALAVNLAAAAARHLESRGRHHGSSGLPRVLLIDTSVQQADAGAHLGRHTPTVETLFESGYWKNPDALDLDALRAALVVDDELGIAALLGPTDRARAHPLYFTGRRYREFVEAVGQHFDIVVVDTPVSELYHDMFREFIIPRSDRIAVLVDNQRGSAVNANAWLELLLNHPDDGGLGVPADRAGVLRNRVQPDDSPRPAGTPRTAGAADVAFTIPGSLAGWDLLGAISESSAFAAAEHAGGIALDAGDQRLAAELEQVWATLLPAK